MAITPWQAGQRITASRLAQITPRWASWTPTWTTTTGVNLPSFGNANIIGQYCQTGDMVIAQLQVIFGTTTNFGGGGTGDNWLFSVPVTASSTSNTAGHFELNASTSERTYSRARLLSTTEFCLETSSGKPDGNALSPTGVIDSATPWTWSSTDAIYGTLIYQAA